MENQENTVTTAYTKLVIYCFSGTGNSRNVAEWISDVAAARNVDCSIINIAKTDRHSIEPPEPGALIVFTSPIHGFNYPPVMLKFFLRFPRGKNKVVLINTRAGMLIGKFITPGVTGIAFYLASLILLLKGYAIKALKPFDMPSNWISLHPGLNLRTVEFIHAKNRERVRKFTGKILEGKSHFTALLEFYDILLLPIAIGYYLVGRFFLAKSFYASAACTNCDLCIKSCPVKAIIKVGNRPFWTFRCESCMHCMGNCPERAIETGHGYIIGFSLLFNIVIMSVFYKYIEQYLFPVENALLRTAIESVLFLSLLALLYRLIHWLMRFRFFERLIVFTSFTKYKWWGRRYKALKGGKS
jgi:ferredoxin